MKYIFLFTLSPVQSFIAQARKTQDLYAGSQILSELARTAATEANKNQGIKLVFPKNTEERASFPNRFIGTIEGDSTDLQSIGQAIEDAVIAKFKKLAEKALEDVEYQNDVPNGFWEQINNHLDINWLFHEIKDNNYEAAYKEIEPLMASLKNVRLITNKYPEAGRKCSLDGELNALFRGQHTTNSQLKNQALPISKGAWLNANEGLSAVSLIKRTYKNKIEGKKSFPSTAAISLSHYIENLEDWQKTNFGIYKSFFGDKFDEQLCYKENMTQKYLEQNGYKDILDRCSLDKLQKLRSNAFGDKELPKYYAIISFDGDKMGKLLSGKTRKDKTTDLAAFQGKVSEKLMTFGKWVYDTLDRKKIDVVYAGGDDFLGFVNLHHLFEVVTELRTQFDEQVNKVLKNELKNDFTFSMGIAIAHYKTPLSIVLKTAHDMEKKAKNDGQRNAFAIAALKHSGENHKAYFNWDLAQNELPKWNALQELKRYFVDKDCSDTFLRALENEFYLLQDKDGNVKNEKRTIKSKNTEGVTVETEVSMIQSELLRLATKSLQEGKKNRAKKLTDTTWELFETDTKILHETVNVKNGIEAVKVALFIKRQTRDNGN